MQIFNGNSDLIAFLNAIKISHSKVGFVPTMGALHQGHLSLIKQSIADNEVTVVSIFVNPTQFNQAEDLEKYPRNIDKDVALIETVSKDIVIYAPTVFDIYGNHVSSEKFDFDGLENQMEGKFRPGHFDGVGTIVKRLFEIVNPDVAYFGEKDFQQVLIIKKLVSKYKLKPQIIVCPIHREPNGLAMSSRNERLTDSERASAKLIYQTLEKAKTLFQKKSAKQVTEWVQQKLEQTPNFKLEYFEITDQEKLLPCQRKIKNKKYRAFIAVMVNNVRLIDTLSLN
jgi:pantoate--beta-alanine ligase